MAELKKIHVILAFVILQNIESISSQNPDFSLFAIDIDTNKVQSVETPNTLTITQSRHQMSNVTNTGKTLISRTYEQKLATIYGGILNHTYDFCQDEFYWDLSLKPDAGIKINGKGSPVQVVLTFSKNGCKDIKDTVQIVVFIYVKPFTPAPSFGGFRSIVKRLKEAGSSRKGSEYDVCLWFFTDFSNQEYYVYTASNGVTVIVIPKLFFPHKMDFFQFFGTFGGLRNSEGKRFSHRAPSTPSPKTIFLAEKVNVVTKR